MICKRLSFAPADGWYDKAYSHEPGSSDPSQAWTSNLPFASGELPPAFPDTSAIAPGEVLVLAWQVLQGPADPGNPNFPVIQGPVQLSESSTSYEGMAPGIARSMMLAQIEGRYVQVEVYFGSQNPSSGMKAAAQSALDRLVVSQYRTSSPTVGNGNCPRDLTHVRVVNMPGLNKTLVPGHPDSFTWCDNGNAAESTDQAATTRAQAALNGLPLLPVGTAYACPAIVPPTYGVFFHYPAGEVVLVRYRQAGGACSLVTNGRRTAKMTEGVQRVILGAIGRG